VILKISRWIVDAGRNETKSGFFMLKCNADETEKRRLHA
jgi:hypothetical protein